MRSVRAYVGFGANLGDRAATLAPAVPALLPSGPQAFSRSDPPPTVPPPLARQRLFVLAPLRDLAPGLRPPGWGETVERAYRRQLAAQGSGAAWATGAGG